MTQTDYEPDLSFVILHDDNLTMLLNGEPSYPVALPKSISKKKKRDDRIRIVKKKIFEGCNEMYYLDYVSEENVTKLTKEVVNVLYERANMAAAAAAKDEGEEEAEEEESSGTARANKALELAMHTCEEIFIDDFGRPFAVMKMLDGHVEVHPMDESKFKNWISGLYYSIYDKLLNDEDLKKIIRILMSKADFGGNIPRRKLDLRVRGYNERQYLNSDDDGGNNNNSDNSVSSGSSVGSFGDSLEDFDAIYYDLTNKKWEAIKITAEGWEIDKHPPFLFRRYGAELPQVYPDRNYEPDTLDQFLELWNIKQDENKEKQELLIKVDTITDFWPNTTPKPGIILPSAQGSAKTTAFELRRDLSDPNTALTMSIPKDDNQFKQALAHNYLSFFDNVSDITDSQSDIMCRGITGSGDFKRKLFENDEDVIYSYRRRIGLNGISNVITKPDLLERGLYVEFGQIPKEQRELLRIIRRRHLALKPKVLAFCLDVISEVMAERKKWKGIDEDYFGMKDLIKKNGGLPRMADWSILGEQVAAVIARKEGKPYTPGTFLRAFDENIKILNTEALKASLVAEGLIAFMTNRAVLDNKTEWEGSPTMLLADLNSSIAVNSESIKINTRAKAWPQDPSVLGKDLAKITPNLRPLGIEIETKKTNQNTHYRITILPPLLPLLPPSNPQREEKGGESGGSGSKYENLGGEIIQNIVNMAMSDGNGGSKGYFTWNEAKTVLMCLPVQDPLHCDENQADKTLQALKEEGKIIEFELDKYKPSGDLAL